MLSKKQIDEAKSYNASQVGRLFGVQELPWPWTDMLSIDGGFEWMTFVFQVEKGMKADGKMGPKTWARLRVEQRVEDNEEDKENVVSGEYSNRIIVGGKKISLPSDFIRAGITASNYIDDGEPHFKHKKRTRDLIHFVQHETCGNTAKGCKKTLKRKGYGVQLIDAPNGHWSCHGDLIEEVMVHANQCNKTSFGVEHVNPYNPVFVSDAAIFFEYLKAKWWTWVPSAKSVEKLLKKKKMKKVPRQYVKPTFSQIESSKLMIPWLCEITGVPYRFPTKGLGRRQRKIEGWNLRPAAKPGPGVVAHSDFAGHADGRYILEYLMNGR